MRVGIYRFLIALTTLASVYGRLGEPTVQAPVVEELQQQQQQEEQHEQQDLKVSLETVANLQEQDEQQDAEPTVVQAVDFQRQLWEKNADVFILIDGGSSISTADFETQKLGLIDAIQNVAVVPLDGSMAIGVIQYGSTPAVYVAMTVINSIAVRDSVVQAIRLMGQQGGPSQMGAAVNVAVGAMKPRSKAKQVIVLSTDEITNVGPDLADAVKSGKRAKWKLDHFSVLAFSNTITDAQFRNYYGDLLVDGQLVFAESYFDYRDWIAIAGFGFSGPPPGAPGTVAFPPNPTQFNFKPSIVINKPMNGATVDPTQRLNLAADVADYEDGSPSGAAVHWFLNNDSKAIATGKNARIKANTLQPGTWYTLKAVARDSRGATDEATIQFVTSGKSPGEVSTPVVLPNKPTVFISNPVQGTTFAANVRIQLAATAYDASGLELTGPAIQWFLNNSPTAYTSGSTARIQKNTLPGGVNWIRAVATDGRGQKSDDAWVWICIGACTNPPTNPPPTVPTPPAPVRSTTITSPGPGQNYPLSSNINLIGLIRVNGVEVNPPAFGVTTWWDIPGQGRLWGPRHIISATSFGSGQKTVYFSSQSSIGPVQTASVTFVVGTAPNFSVTITSPVANAVYAYDDPINLKATPSSLPGSTTWWFLPGVSEPLYGNDIWVSASWMGSGRKTITCTSFLAPTQQTATSSVSIVVGPQIVNTPATLPVTTPGPITPGPGFVDVPTVQSPVFNAVFTLEQSIPLIASTNFPSTFVDWRFPNTQGLENLVINGKSTSVAAQTLGLGTHTVLTRSVTQFGVVAEVRTQIRVAQGSNSPPTVKIETPKRNDIFHTGAGSNIELSATAKDPEDGILFGQNIKWYTNNPDRNTPLGQGQRLSIPAAKLALGRHMITAVANDNFGASASHSMPIQITQGPIVLITAPQSGFTFKSTQVPLVADVRQWQGGPVQDANVKWYAIADGKDEDTKVPIGTGRSTSTTTAALGVGNWEILVIATTDDNRIGRDKNFITVSAL